MRCAVCGSDEGRQHHVVSGASYGTACAGECAGLLWEAYFIARTPDADPAFAAYENELTRWRWRRRRAEVEGRAFTERPPQSPGERAGWSSVYAKGWDDVLREIL